MSILIPSKPSEPAKSIVVKVSGVSDERTVLHHLFMCDVEIAR